MSAPAFTPGPWIAHGKDVFTALGAPDANGRCCEENDSWQVSDCGQGLCFIGGDEAELGLKEQFANARLTAAAPELYDALRAFVTAIEADSEPLPGTRWHRELMAARAALAKAVQP
jgi:hypothetical protein